MSSGISPISSRNKVPPSANSIRPIRSRKAIAKVRAAENAWNTRDPKKISLLYIAASFGSHQAIDLNHILASATSSDSPSHSTFIFWTQGILPSSPTVTRSPG
ncbi:DUF1348 family protein [Pirellulaceae bacterium SH467]